MSPIDPSAAGSLPAPYWFIELFKTLGFILHSVPMQLWLAGLPMALLLLLVGGPNAKNGSRRFLTQLPFIMAFGINLGIVPLLFIQTAYGRAFYPATILTAWHWFGIIPIVLIAYLLIYLTASLSQKGYKWRPIFSGLGASLCLIVVGLFFTSTWSLMSDTGSWTEILNKHSIAGAVTGLGAYWNPVILLRFAQTVGLAFLTLSCWALIDAYWFYRGAPLPKPAKTAPAPAKPQPKPQYKTFQENPNLSKKERKRLQRLQDRGELSVEEELKALEAGPPEPKQRAPEIPVDSDSYRRWMLRFALCIQWFGLAIAGTALGFYYYKALTPEMPNLSFLFQSGAKFLPITVFVLLGVFAVLALLGMLNKLRERRLAVLLFLTDVLILAFWAVIRQLIQNAQLKDYLDVSAIPAQVQWGPLVTFLIIFVLGLLIVFWMLRAAVRGTSTKKG